MSFFQSSSKKSSKSGTRSGSGSGSRSGHTSGSKSDSKTGSKSSSKGSNTVEWCEWEWDAQWQREWRSRQAPDGQWEYQYRYPEGDDVPRTTNDPSRIEKDQGVGLQYSQDPLSGSPPNPSQLSTSSATVGTSNQNVNTAQDYGFNLSSSPGASLTRAMGNLHVNSTISQDDTLDYGAASRSMMGDESTTMTTPQGSLKGGVSYWAPSATGGLTYSTSSPARPAQPFPSSYSQPGPTSYLSAEYTTQTIEEMSKQPLSKQTKSPGSADSEHYISASPREALHKDFKVHHPRDFKFGRVFKILWTEPRGQGLPNTKGTDRLEGVTFPTTFGEDVYTSIRRFVICKAKDGHCLCLPILTYQGKATTKRGVKPQDHAIVYTKEKGQKTKTPKEIEGEEKLRKRSIRITPYSAREQLDKLSRLNYAKIYTVEYNVKVSFVGQIHDDSTKYFIRDFNAMHQPLPEAADVAYSDESEGEEQ